MLRKILVTIMLAGLATSAAAQVVYKWVDATGQVYFTDRPPTQPGTRLLSVLEHGYADSNERQPATETTPPATTPDEPAVSANTAASVQQDLERTRKEQCTQAQERYKTYVESRRLFRQLPDGKREYLSDEELMKARIEARKAVDDNCS